MSSTFETVLKQAKALPAADRKRLAEALTKSKNRKSTTKKWDDDPVVLELRAWVDEMERTENPKRNSAAKMAERIREWNDRGFKL